ncbi:Intracellular sulfur oxidation protein, DsrE/DsrF family [Rhizobiales bacterium GAS191]|nr:Intracellular sulfur oxidation protein, DsrE/DsrF family [Rhizobiales bacterium GAS191]SEC83914.1 Intracellular sulfur oxidation protein, DsrE/DsrF family [Rhizobiales bacterium GAS188]
MTITTQSQLEQRAGPSADARSTTKKVLRQPVAGRIASGNPWRLAAVVAAAGLVTYSATYALARHPDPAAIEGELAGLGRSVYQPQKVVYHVDYEAGWRGHNYYNLVGVLENHEKALGADRLQLVVVLQGSGTDFLALAKAKPALAKKIDALKSQGVRFLICKNSLINRGIDPFTELYGVAKEDIVAAAVAELVALQQEGYVYLHL